MTLKVVCGQLAQKPQALDVLLLFEKLPTVLEPLCMLLDNWRYEEDQGEYQPVYEEYGAVLLLVLALAYRYQLAPTDVGSQLPDGAVTTILARAHVAREVSELTEKEKEHLNGWIQGLFDSDTGGLGDELMSSCPPKDFYLLIATLFYNTVAAYTHGHLSDESLKSGVECKFLLLHSCFGCVHADMSLVDLVDTFLLPSLVPAILFLSEYLWVDSKEQKSVLKVLQLILLPKSISGEASTMLTAVKNLVAKPLEHALKTCQKREPSCQDIEPLLRALTDSLRLSRRTSGAEHNELEQWCAAQGSGLASTIKRAVRALVSWSMNPATNMMPTMYSHRQIMAGVRILGAKRVLYLMLECVQQSSEAGSANIVYDVVTALVCAPDVTTQAANHEAGGNVSSGAQRLLTLREVLRMEAEECKKIQKEDANMAEMLVRLHRRVEAQMVVPPQAVLPVPDMTLGMDGDTAIAAAAAAAGANMAADAMGVDGMALGMGLGAGDLGLGGPSNDGGMDLTGDGSDLFGGLDDADMGVGEMSAGDLEMFENWPM
jgi:mediator of RNA polymerase II transcription subunit 5